MKLILVTWLAIGVVISGSLGVARSIGTQYITNTNTINLSVKQPLIELGLSYPGPQISSLCGVELRADSYGRGTSSMQDFFNAIIIKGTLGIEPVVIVKNRMTIDIDLSAAIGSYGTWFSIETKDGSSLKDTILETLGTSRTVVIVGTVCKSE